MSQRERVCGQERDENRKTLNQTILPDLLTVNSIFYILSFSKLEEAQANQKVLEILDNKDEKFAENLITKLSVSQTNITTDESDAEEELDFNKTENSENKENIVIYELRLLKKL